MTPDPVRSKSHRFSIRLAPPLWMAPFTAALAWMPYFTVTDLAGQPVRQAPPGDAVVRGQAGPSEIVITTTSRLAGAIHSLTWNGKEFIDSADHGRQLQSAANFDLQKPFFPEVFNPTEAGSRWDGAGDTSSSRLLSLKVAGQQLETTTQIAFWLRPGEDSEGHSAYNKKTLSDHRLSKRVVIGHKQLSHAIKYDVSFTIPPGENHSLAQFEALTGYMPGEFDKFWTLDPDTGDLDPLDDGPGYGRFRFRAENVVKWNCVYRVRNPAGIEPGEYRYQIFVAVGNRETVRETLKSLARP